MFTNLRELIVSMPDEKSCREYVAKQRWNGQTVCPYCGLGKCYTIENGERYKCANNKCYKRFTVTVGTIFHASNIPLTKWLMAVYIVTAHKKGISSYQLAKDIGVTQKTAWFMNHRIREVLKPTKDEILQGLVEVDETYLAKKYRSKYKALPPDEVTAITEQQQRDKVKSKGAVIGLVQRDGNAIVKAIGSISRDNIREMVTKHVNPENTTLMTDESNLYKYSLRNYNRQSVTHSKLEWTNGIVHTNTVEGLWSVMKRGIYGIYHHVTAKHLQAYCNEFAYRYNSRKIKDNDRFILSLQNLEVRLPYKTLVSEKESQIKDTRSNYRKNKFNG